MNITDKPLVVKKNSDGSEYIPIGHVEETLDELFYSWGTSNFRFNVFNVGDSFFANGIITLMTKDTEDDPVEYMEGSSTFKIFPNDLNTDYAPTTESLCIANAAKRKGIIFGRALNGRLETGENALPSVQIRDGKSAEADAEFAETKRLMLAAKNREAAKSIMTKRGFKYNEELKQLLETIKQ